MQPISRSRRRSRARLLAKGKEVFLARCSRCHGENGDKPLKTGVPLSERALSSDVIARAVKGRLRDGTVEERQAVTLHFQFDEDELRCSPGSGSDCSGAFDCVLLGHKRIMVYPYQFE
jgi:mono/diheme cytochrome c family protein